MTSHCAQGSIDCGMALSDRMRRPVILGFFVAAGFFLLCLTLCLVYLRSPVAMLFAEVGICVGILTGCLGYMMIVIISGEHTRR